MTILIPEEGEGEESVFTILLRIVAKSLSNLACLKFLVNRRLISVFEFQASRVGVFVFRFEMRL